MAELTKLRGVAVGTGYFSQFHLEAWSRIDEVKLLAVCDLDREKAGRAAAAYGIQTVYADAVEMLDRERPDFVDIITRADSHHELIHIAAERGIDVICQKPLAPAFAESQAVVKLAGAAGIRLMVHENFRFQPWHRAIRSLIDRGDIGNRIDSLSCRTRTGDGWQPDAYLARQPYFVSMPQLLIFETGVHFIDIFRFLAGEIEGVFASLRKLNATIAGEDTGVVLFEFASGARGLWDASRYHEPNYGDSRYTFGEFLIEGNRGAIRLYPDGRLTVKLLGQAEEEHEYPHQRLNFSGDCVYHTQRHFVQALLQESPFETSGEEYLKTLLVQQAVYRSAESGQPVRRIMRRDNHADR